MNDASLAMTPTHGIRIRRLRLHGPDRSYDIDFRTPHGTPRALAVIAGAFSTGKTTILEFVDYCLGASRHPQHPEITPKVRAVTLEVDLSGRPHLIERAVGTPSTFASVRAGRMDTDDGTPAERRPLRPAHHPGSLSSLLLAHCKLQGVQLRGAASPLAGTDPLSFRSLMWLCFLPNDRLDNRNLLLEDTPLKNLKLRQVFDVVFDVHDDRSVELGRAIRALEVELDAARTAHDVAEQIVVEQHLGSRTQLEDAQQRAKANLADVERSLADVDAQARASTSFAADLREQHRAAALATRQAAARQRDCETQLQRMEPLRAQYAQDVTELTMLAEAHRFFDPLHVTTCPACLSALPRPATIADGHCTLCQSEVVLSEDPVDVTGELRAARARLGELTGYIAELERMLPALRAQTELAHASEVRAAAEIDAACGHAVTPYLAQRDSLARRREDATTTLQRTAIGLRLLDTLQRRANDLTHLESSMTTLRSELADATRTRTTQQRGAVVHRVSDRYRDILAAWRYPKLTGAYLADDLTPFVREHPYTMASSGGQTLISLAWQLAVFEIAWETGSSHPGFLLLDSPQKNLGMAGEHDVEFADSVTVADIYRHVQGWLAGPGAGAQIIVADNAPPPEADPDVIVRFSRRPDQPPYGLIDDDTE
jgi:hypothetical protein